VHFRTELELPLSREEFRRALRAGLGRARLHVDQFGAEGVRDDILAAATSCQIYDPQVDGFHADWLAELCVQAELAERVIAQPAQGEYWDRAARCRLLKELALLGYPSARTALYAACERQAGSGDVFACGEIVELDGAAGLRFVARKLGRWLAADAAFWVDDIMLWIFDEAHGKGAGAALLQAEAPADAAIQRYLAGIARTQELRQKAPRPVVSAQAAVEAIVSADRRLTWIRGWGRRASASELAALLPLVTPTATPIVLENVFHCLSGAKQPPFDPSFLQLLEHADANVRDACTRTLARVRHPAVRAAGLATLPTDLETALTLLQSSAEPEDAATILAALRSPADHDDDPHGVLADLVGLFEHSQLREPLLALHVYEHSHCMHCRKNAVKHLLAHSAAPLWLQAECARDASEDIRQLFAAAEE
jgi:hypothetical protein